ncbi:MAG: hypothetical protein AB9856_14345 [Cellulosilyticaceae bacterium]
METVRTAINMILAEAKKEYGEDFKMEEGETYTGVFNDGIVQLGIEEGKMKVNIEAGAPYKFDYDLDLLEK